MKKEEKIFLEKSEGIEDIEKKISHTPLTTVILNIPKDSVLSHSVEYFKELKKIAAKYQKEIIIESIDEKILDLASLAGFSAYNAIFKRKKTIIADIIPERKKHDVDLSKDLKEKGEKKQDRGLEKKKELKAEKQQHEEKEETDLEEILEDKKPSEFKRSSYYDEENINRFAYTGKRKSKTKSVTLLVIFILLLGGSFYTLTYLLPKLSVTLDLKETNFDFNVQLVVYAKNKSPLGTKSSNLSDVLYIPGQLLANRGNMSMHFEAEGEEKEIKTKAEGVLTLYNYYSPSPLTFVANTRFLSTEGKIFRAKNKVVVPGYSKDKNGNIVPGSVAVEVVADDFGEEYNVGPSSWELPGLKGSPMYGKVYAESKNYMKGGFIGKKILPSESFLSQAKEKVASELKNNLENQIAILDLQKFKILDKAQVFEIADENVQYKDKGFDVFVAGTLKEFAFSEDDVKEKLIARYSMDKNIKWEILSFSPRYDVVSVDFDKGEMIVNLSGTIAFRPFVDTASLKAMLVGKKYDDLRKIITQVSGLESADISLWPFWAWQAPMSVSRIFVEIK